VTTATFPAIFMRRLLCSSAVKQARYIVSISSRICKRVCRLGR
jgi:hypothetical protein